MDQYIEIKKSLKEKGNSGLALDIDETLAWTNYYWVDALQKKFGNPENLSIQDLISKYKFTQNVPYWQIPEAIKWMDDHIHSNDVQEILPLIEFSNASVEKINEIIPISLYLTTRPESVVGGTRKWLAKHGFPRVDIIARPPIVGFMDGSKWKAQVLEFLYPEIQGIIDDNPSLVKNLSNKYKGKVYLYDNETTERSDIDVIPCKTWDYVLEKVKLHSDLV